VGLADHIAPAAKPSSSAPPKYRHPEDATKTWTGRGKRPGWLTALLAQCNTLEELEIHSA
jgi:DNA-binding protein H-NS